MMYMVKVNETIELPELPGVKATNVGDTSDFIKVVDGVVKIGPEFLSEWTFATTSELVDMPTVKRG
jgi:hypothetical protein